MERSCCHCENNRLIPEYRPDGVVFDNMCAIDKHNLSREIIFKETKCENFERIK